MRYKIVRISPLLFSDWFTEGNEIHAKCIVGLPKGAKLAYFFQDSRYYINAVFEYESFSELNSGDLIPEFSSPSFEKLSCAPKVILEDFKNDSK